MGEELKENLLKYQLIILDAASQVLKESYQRVEQVLRKGKGQVLSVGDKESCEALTARFARLFDFLFQKVFRTLDQVELQEEGTGIDRLNRSEKRGIISSSNRWRELKELRNEIAHEYLIEQSDRALIDTFKSTPELLSAVEQVKLYVEKRGYLNKKVTEK